MSDRVNHTLELPQEQRAIRDRCFHPSGAFDEFPIEDVETSVPARFEKIAQQFSQRMAVKTSAGALTYEALNTSANRVAHGILKQMGDRVETVVLISGQDLETIISCLAVLKAGKILVSVDTAYPFERIRRTAEDCQARMILTEEETFSLGKDLASPFRTVIKVSDLYHNGYTTRLDTYISPDAAAEIRYSSGSTGAPKGIVRTHRLLLF